MIAVKKQLVLSKIFTVFIIIILISSVFLLYLKPQLYICNPNGRPASLRKPERNSADSASRRTYVDDKLEKNTDSCPYYGEKNGLFHPTVKYPRFIVTGGAGFIGSHLVKRLRRLYNADQIKVLDNMWRGRFHNLQFPNGTWAISGTRDFCLVDLRNADETMKFVRGADVVFHLADVVAGVSYVFSHQESVFRDNILINSNTLYAAKTNQIRNFIYVGTACSFPKFLQDGPGIHALKEEQTYPAQPESSYGWSKLMGEYESELAKSDEFKVGLLRLHNVYGPYSDYADSTGQVIPSLIRKFLDAHPSSFVVWGSGKQYRDFIYVNDVVDGLLLTLEKGMNKGVIQVGTAEATNIKDLANIVNRLGHVKFGKKKEITFDVSQPEGDTGRIAVLDRARNILGWSPKVQLEEGVSATMSWIGENQRRPRVLVIIIGEARGGNLAWKSLHQFLLRPLRAHLAIYISNWQKRTLLHDLSQFIWTIPDYKEWDIIFNKIADSCHIPKVRDMWRNYCQIPGIFMGGISNCSHPASAGILLAFRWLVQQKIYELNLLEKYDWFILTRADELYLCNHYDFLNMNNNHALLPTGEYYGGWSDRHIIGKSTIFMRMINITVELTCNPDYWFQRLRSHGGDFNLERIQKVMWSSMNLTVSEFPRSMFTVRAYNDSTRWSQGTIEPNMAKFGLRLKYPLEFASSCEHCKIANLTKTMQKIDEYDWQR